ncbi:MAG: phosphonate C-P lyase system protein PhnG [Bacillota bacterium]|uniref:Phosphonate C-P lyase system protein PhnG n=1 Tax=Virgibacillus salarius TaxID=447199 RepID=A0A941DQY5_9BACI|nr:MULTISPECIES: phosphonate C-P lyase system protein PhnG [Bacillaceae]NAZ07640.1 phosphonate C-P lyase system protein PhnG [Agaribacter marinus]MBR7794920.1 phosphonate C-P lyase system protein PhnG [Virgibacillus salarius]MCC2249415.1 phosphonate C-P lyase system protein PhnG [Virgibacillus sp. AGTR]MDY7045033.1 phosphonate C-P lyase system protein PhnG [Virgibacillus sp. M23]QRZ18795.1 phosphonate C-P lyase system protein PhnG [Virgibacillus sp. AGTR]
MKRRRRTEILIQDDTTLAKQLAEGLLQNYTYREIVAPHYGLTMVKMRESAKNSLFYIGEVLVTEAKVEINQHVGIGVVQGMEDELALQLAIIDAAYNANLPQTKEWHDLLLQAEAEITMKKAKKQAELFETKVNFETMDN